MPVTKQELDQASSVLDGAVALLKGGGWVRRTWAADRQGKGIGVLDTGACSYCLMGALRRAREDVNLKYDKPYRLAVGAVMAVIGKFQLPELVRADDVYRWSCAIAGWNDNCCSGVADAMRILREASKLVREKGIEE